MDSVRILFENSGPEQYEAVVLAGRQFVRQSIDEA